MTAYRSESLALTADFDTRRIGTIRAPCIDTIEVARYGYPGTPIEIEDLRCTGHADSATSFVESWNDLLEIIDRQSATLTA
jgi:hypothetical protein